MRGINKNKLNKVEKNKKVKEGECVFPFKYRGKTYKTNECAEKDDSKKYGKICATSVSKHGTLKTYGYCVNDSSKKRTEKKATEKKATEKKATEKKATEKKATEKKTPEKTLRSSTLKTPTLKVSRKLNKTIKVRSKKIDKTQETQSKDDIEPQTESITMSLPKKRLNEELIDILEEYTNIMQKKGDKMRVSAYRRAANALIMHTKDITSADQLKTIKHIGKNLQKKLEEYVSTGKIASLEKLREDPINILTSVYGIGPSHAKKFIDMGVTTIDELNILDKSQPDLLTKNMKIGLKYYKDIEKKIPREEIKKFQDEFEKAFNASTAPTSKFEIVGSYRRGKLSSGDIDVIITDRNNIRGVFNAFLEELKKRKIIIESLSHGETKSLTIAKLPGETTARRVDFLYTPYKEYPFALLYFTGSKAFNTIQRQRAVDMGYSLNEHGLYKVEKKKKTKLTEPEFITEKDIFTFLNMRYVPPHLRIDGRSVIPLKPEEDSLKKSEEDSLKKPEEDSLKKSEEDSLKKPEEDSLKKPEEDSLKKPEEDSLKKPEEDSLKKSEEDSLKKLKRPLEKNTIKVKRRRTLKRRLNKSRNANIDKFKKEGYSALQILTEDQLSVMIRAANDAYYCNSNPILTDNEYDILREYTLQEFPMNEAAKEGHTKCDVEVEKNKVVLPYEMWSMDKIKPDTSALASWIEKYSGPYVLSCKLDGVSGLYSTETDNPTLYTRGNGKVGQNISHLIPYLRLPKTKDITIRGEFIVPKTVFIEKYSGSFANSRNFVAGVINQKRIDPEKYKDIDFVAYEVVSPQLKVSQQFELLENEDVDVVKHLTTEEISNDILSDLLIEWRDSYEYEIDGVICINDDIYPRMHGNPTHAFAFKMVLSDQIAEAKVLDVVWTASKDGFLKPRVRIEPVVLGGVNITYATGFNAKFIEDNKIGVGALIKLVRSGDVIPHIVSVIQPASQPLMPSEEYVWNNTRVDILLKNAKDNQTVKEKQLLQFFTTIGVEGVGRGNVRKLVLAGYDTAPKILRLSKEKFKEKLLEIDGFKEKTAEKISAGVQSKIEKISISVLMHASNVFSTPDKLDKGEKSSLGKKKFAAILKKYPTILVEDNSDDEKIAQVITIDGMGKKTAEKFVKRIPVFLKWMSESNLIDLLNDMVHVELPQPIDSKDKEKEKEKEKHELYEKKVVLTGMRDKDLIEKLNEFGAELQTNPSKATYLVIAADPSAKTNKLIQARNKYNISPDRIINKEQFFEKYVM